MLNLMRRSANTWVIKLLLILVALSFVVWGVGDYVNRQSQQPVVEAKGWVIGPREFAQAYENDFNRMRQRFGGALDKKTAEMFGLKQQTLNGLINRRLLLAAARDMRLTVSPDMLRANIADNPAFARNGRFDKERYETLLRNNRMSPQEFESTLVADILVSQLQGVLGEPMVLPDLILEDAFRLEKEKRVVDVISLNPEKLIPEIKVTEEELEAYLKENQSRYMTPLRVKLRYVVLGPDSVRGEIEVTQEQRQAFYDEHSNEFLREEKRQARHILVRIDEKTDAEAALKKIRAAQKRIEGGESFETVAKAVSEDVSAEQGGDLGEFSPGMMVKAFDDVAFSLPVGKVSEPVKTDFGYHLIRVDKIHEREVKTLDKVAKEIDGRIIERRAQDLVYERSIVLEDQLFASGDLKAISKDLNLRYVESGFIDRKQRHELKGIEKEVKFLDAAFSTAKGETSTLIETADGRFFALEVVDRQEPEPKKLTDVRKELEEAQKRDKARELAKKEMEKVVEALSKDQKWSEAAKIHDKMVAETLKPFTRNGNQKGATPPVRAAAFKLKLDKPDHPQVIEEATAFKVVRLKEIQAADMKELDKVAERLSPKLLESLGHEQLTAWLNGLWKAAGIRVNQEMLDRF